MTVATTRGQQRLWAAATQVPMDAQYFFWIFMIGANSWSIMDVILGSMAGFEGVKWASKQMRFILDGKDFDLFDADDKVYAVSRSIHYAQFLCFEGIRFYCKKNNRGHLEIIFLNWNLNLERFQKGIAFCLAERQQHLVPSPEEMENIFIHHYFKDPSMRDFLE